MPIRKYAMRGCDGLFKIHYLTKMGTEIKYLRIVCSLGLERDCTIA